MRYRDYIHCVVFESLTKYVFTYHIVGVSRRIANLAFSFYLPTLNLDFYQTIRLRTRRCVKRTRKRALKKEDRLN